MLSLFKVMKSGRRRTAFLLFVVSALLALSACGGNDMNSSGQSQAGPLSANWQFKMSAPADHSFFGGITGGFLEQAGNNVTGSVAYSIYPTEIDAPCAGGDAVVQGSYDGNSVSLTVTAGQQTFTLKGNLSSDGSTMLGTYSSTAGAKGPDGKSCGSAQSGLQWSAVLVPPLNGDFQGSLHSSSGGELTGRDFPVTGTLTQGASTGASSATITGTLTSTDYPCFPSASLTGTISGSSVILHIVEPDGLEVGTIGRTPTSLNSPGPASFEKAMRGSGYVLRAGLNVGYTVQNKACSGVSGDAGNVCFGLKTATGCTEPISLTPATLVFPEQIIGSEPTSQSIVLKNTDPLGTAQSLNLSFSTTPSDFNLQPNFSQSNDCGHSPFTLAPDQSCTITVTFNPQESCPKDASLVPPTQCPAKLTAAIAINSPINVDGTSSFVAGVVGTAQSAVSTLTHELDYSAAQVSHTTSPQVATFTNQSQSPVQILPSIPGKVCVPAQVLGTKAPAPGLVPGVQIVTKSTDGTFPTFSDCDMDPSTGLPNFQIVADSCSGNVLAPQQTCDVGIQFAPQPSFAEYDFLNNPRFVQIYTVPCGTTQVNCEPDSGRFPLQVRANNASPLRLSPSATVTFPPQAKGTTSLAQTVTLYNDPTDPHHGTVQFAGIAISSTTLDFRQTNTCGSSLAPGESCTISVIFTPSSKANETAAIVITPAQATEGNAVQWIYLYGAGM